jgi:flavodoxin
MLNYKLLCLLPLMAMNSGIPKDATASHDPVSGMSSHSIVEVAGKNILIVYLSRTGNTQAIGQIIQKNVGGKLVALELVNPYPQDYHAQVAQVVRENESGFLPPLKTRIDSIENYDIIFIGFPTWDMQMPPPIKSFLKQYDLSSKTVMPFNTNAGYGVGSGFQTVKDLCPKSTVMEGLSIKGGVERDGILFVMKGQRAIDAEKEVQTWLRKIKILK